MDRNRSRPNGPRVAALQSNIMNRLRVIGRSGFPVVAIAAILAAVQPAHASLIYYIETGVISGRLNGVSFSNAAVTLSTVADTDNITSLTLGGFPYYENAGTTTVQIAGFAPATLQWHRFLWGIFRAGYAGGDFRRNSR